MVVVSSGSVCARGKCTGVAARAEGARGASRAVAATANAEYDSHLRGGGDRERRKRTTHACGSSATPVPDIDAVSSLFTHRMPCIVVTGSGVTYVAYASHTALAAQYPASVASVSVHGFGSVDIVPLNGSRAVGSPCFTVYFLVSINFREFLLVTQVLPSRSART